MAPSQEGEAATLSSKKSPKKNGIGMQHKNENDDVNDNSESGGIQKKSKIKAMPNDLRQQLASMPSFKVTTEMETMDIFERGITLKLQPREQLKQQSSTRHLVDDAADDLKKSTRLRRLSFSARQHLRRSSLLSSAAVSSVKNAAVSSVKTAVKVATKITKPGADDTIKCFNGKDAVDFLIKLQLASTRDEAVELGRKWEKKYNFFEHISRRHQFEDDQYLWYRFVDRQDRYFSIYDNASTYNMIQLQKSSRNLVTTSEALKDLDFSHRSDSADESDKSSSSSFSDDDEKQIFKFLELSQRRLVEGGGEEEETQTQQPKEGEIQQQQQQQHEDSNITDIVEAFRKGVSVQNHKHNMYVYEDTFIGSEAVDFLVNSKFAKNRADAVRIGRALASDYNLFGHITGDETFSDDNFLYRFTQQARKVETNLRVQRTSSGTFLDLSHYSDGSDEDELYQNEEQKLKTICESFRAGVHVSTHRHRGKAYRRTFTGNDAVTFLVNSSYASTRRDAVELGRKLMTKMNLFHPVDYEHYHNATKTRKVKHKKKVLHDFKDDCLFYRFTDIASIPSGVSRDGAKLSSVKIAVSSLSLEEIVKVLKIGIEYRSYKNHRKVFTGKDIIDFLVNYSISHSRVDAVGLGRKLNMVFNLFVCVNADDDYDYDIKDEQKLFYRFILDSEKPAQILDRQMFLRQSHLMEICRAFEKNIKLQTNRQRHRVFKNTFSGKQAVDFFVQSGYAKSREEAIRMGRTIIAQFDLFQHVTKSRKFDDKEHLYFRLTNEKERPKKLQLERSSGQRRLLGPLDDVMDDFSDRSASNGALVDFGQGDFLDGDDLEWSKKAINFERKKSLSIGSIGHHRRMSSVSTSTRSNSGSRRDSSEVDDEREELHDKVRIWMSSFLRLDPRFQMRYFFDEVAQEGAENVEHSGLCGINNMRLLARFLPNRASVFTVWRPTSKDSIRKMMLGEAVGKGLDIKGKSAKRGKLSAFVPFLQISDNAHKKHVRVLPKEGRVRLFFPGEARRARDFAAEKLEAVLEEMMLAVQQAKRVLDNDTQTEAGDLEATRQDALNGMMLDMADPTIHYIDDYSPERYGLDLPIRLFWEAYFIRQDCTRVPGSEYDTGRPSLPTFQDMNLATLYQEPNDNEVSKKNEDSQHVQQGHRAVIYQHANADSPMNPFELLMAYEENGKVLPVVSDFDCFLVGTKRVTYKSPMALEQLSVLRWCTYNIGQILDDTVNEDIDDKNWTRKWLEVLRIAAKDGFHPNMPQFGFSDPKSYSIMENAVDRLKDSGAVRHGAECFNYYFPQDLDDEFLIICDDLPGNVPWMYLKSPQELTSLLSQKIDQGYTFPLNPKWILVDGGEWKTLYDKLRYVKENTTNYDNIVDSMNIWFPPDSGLREEIDRISQRHPNGFYDDRSS